MWVTLNAFKFYITLLIFAFTYARSIFVIF